MAENASFGVLIDEIRKSVFAVGDDKKKQESRAVAGNPRDAAVIFDP